jgi:NTP pyrophosphatase (non-canonical NTP hydrolase)
MDLATAQAEVDTWIRAHGGYWGEMSLLARLTEETGELAREYNHRFGEKRKKASEADRALADEMGDVLFILVCMANQQGIDLGEALGAVMDKLRVRDADRFPPRAG